MRRESLFFLYSHFLLSALTGVSVARTIYVPEDYAKIQWAVDNTSVGDTIIVSDGTYTENVDVI